MEPAREPLMTVSVDEELNVLFEQDFDADWSRIEAAMRALLNRLQQQFRDRGLCPFAPIDLSKESRR